MAVYVQMTPARRCVVETCDHLDTTEMIASGIARCTVCNTVWPAKFGRGVPSTRLLPID